MMGTGERRGRGGGWGCAVALAVLLLPIIWWFAAYPDFTGRFKLEVTAEGGGKTFTGATVYDVTYVWQPKILPDVREVHLELTGEALFLDFGEGRNLVVTLTDSGSGRPFRRANISQSHQFEDLWKSSGARSAAALPHIAFELHMASWQTFFDLKAARKKGQIELPIDRLPTTVTFTDLADPKSVKLVDPRDLEAIFGPGYRITRATIEVTDEPLTKRIEEKLPWLHELYERRARLNGSNSIAIFTNALSDRLGSGDFKIGDW